jgi:hypothetical protein
MRLLRSVLLILTASHPGGYVSGRLPRSASRRGIQPLQHCPAGRWQGSPTRIEKGGPAPCKRAAWATAIWFSLPFPPRHLFCSFDIHSHNQTAEQKREMSLTIDKILAAAPVTTRGQPTQLSCDAKGERIAYAVSPIASLLS